ncbi:MAG: NUDIX hydrolase [Thermodesulfobacteriota bacterium]
MGGVVIHQGRVLLVKRANPPARGSWNIPGGAIRLGETLEEALRREILEETGLEVEPKGVAGVVERIYSEADAIEYHYLIVDYACRLQGGSLRASSDAQEAHWFSKEELWALDLPSDTLKVIERARELLGDSSLVEF